MKLKNYIEKHGIPHLAALLEVTERRVSSWYYSEREPRPDMARKIQEATNGKVKIKDCYE